MDTRNISVELTDESGQDEGVGAFIVNERIDMRKLLDELSMKLAHLEAQTVVIYGEGYESFDGLLDRLKDNYLWGLHQGISEAQAIVRGLNDCWRKSNQRLAGATPNPGGPEPL